eukprot:jgi/Bigna1/143651/aug1.80_g18359
MKLVQDNNISEFAIASFDLAVLLIYSFGRLFFKVSVNLVDERARAGQQMPLRLGEDGSDSGAGGDSKESTLVDEETHPDEGKDGTDDDEDDETGRDAKSSAESTSISATCCSYFNDN